jgi:hypothetical protein
VSVVTALVRAAGRLLLVRDADGTPGPDDI